MTRLIIARHGNTFAAGETPTRVGARTDLPLVEKGKAQARTLGLALKTSGLVPEHVYTSELMRTKETAMIALNEMGLNIQPEAKAFLNEIDYGPDENKVEEEVVARIGQEAIQNWDKHALPPQGWLVEPEQIKQDWINFANELEDGATVLVVTSNGIARFAPYITGDYESFCAHHSIKLSTGAYGVLEKSKDGQWRSLSWNVRPEVK